MVKDMLMREKRKTTQVSVRRSANKFSMIENAILIQQQYLMREKRKTTQVSVRRSANKL
jgi:hypothetical protein